MGFQPRTQGMLKKRRLCLQDLVVDYSLKRSARRKKTVGITVSQGKLEVAAPTRVTVKEIEAILLKRGAWILRMLEAADSETKALSFTSGEILPFFGRDVRLLVEEQEDLERSETRYDGASILVKVVAGLPQEERSERVRSALVGWLKTQAMEYLQESVARWLPVLGRSETPRILVREQRSRWGSCSADQTLRFSWRLAMLEPELIDSVVVHELAHLEVMNHSPAFWGVVLRVMPNALEVRKQLNEKGRQLPL